MEKRKTVRTAAQHFGELPGERAVALARIRESSGTLPVPTISEISDRTVSLTMGFIRALKKKKTSVKRWATHGGISLVL